MSISCYGSLLLQANEPGEVQKIHCHNYNGQHLHDALQEASYNMHWKHGGMDLQHKGRPPLHCDKSAMTTVPFDAIERILKAVNMPTFGNKRRLQNVQHKVGQAYLLFQVDSQIIHIDHNERDPVTINALDTLLEWMATDEVTVLAMQVNEGDVIVFDPTALHAVHNTQSVYSAGVHYTIDFNASIERVAYFVFGSGKTVITFPTMPRGVQKTIYDLGLETTAELALGGAEGVAELRRLVTEATLHE
jgi:hypothetical protein